MKKFLGDDVPNELCLIGQARFLALCQGLQVALKDSRLIKSIEDLPNNFAEALIDYATGSRGDDIAEILMEELNLPKDSFERTHHEDNQSNIIPFASEEMVEGFDFGIIESDKMALA